MLTVTRPRRVHPIQRLDDAQLLALRDQLSVREKLTFKRHLETRPPQQDEFADDDTPDSAEYRAWTVIAAQLRAANNELTLREHIRLLDEASN